MGMEKRKPFGKAPRQISLRCQHSAALRRMREKSGGQGSAIFHFATEPSIAGIRSKQRPNLWRLYKTTAQRKGRVHCGVFPLFETGPKLALAIHSIFHDIPIVASLLRQSTPRGRSGRTTLNHGWDDETACALREEKGKPMLKKKKSPLRTDFGLLSAWTGAIRKSEAEPGCRRSFRSVADGRPIQNDRPA